jgi:deoxyhypusine monooxygenase
LAVHRLDSGANGDMCDSDSDSASTSEFNTRDPVKMGKKVNYGEADIDRLAHVVWNANAPLTERYEAMFALRSITYTSEWGIQKPSPKAMSALALVLGTDQSSALLRHELCFVVAQMAFGSENVGHIADVLAGRLRDNNEASMVRHEAAISLGSIGGEKGSLYGQ